MPINRKTKNHSIVRERGHNIQTVPLSSHRSWCRIGSFLALTSYLNQTVCQFLMVGGMCLVQQSPLKAMEPEDRRQHSATSSSPSNAAFLPVENGKYSNDSVEFYKDAKHPLTQPFWKTHDLSARLQNLQNDVKKIKKEIVNYNSNQINIEEKNLLKYSNILLCSDSDPVFVQDLKEIEYADLLINADDSKRITSGWTKADVVPKSCADAKVVIKKFTDTKGGIEELLCSLIALDINPSPTELKMARIYDAMLCSQSSTNTCLSIIMECANGYDIAHFLPTDFSENAVKACAEYLAMFHINHYKKLNENINKNKHISHLSRFFNTLVHNPYKEEKKELALLSLSTGKTLPDLEEVKSNNIIQLLPVERQKQFAHFVKESCKKFEDNAAKVYRSQDIRRKGPYFLTITHGDAHGNNFFYDADTLLQSGPDIPKDSFHRVTMIDFASIVRTYGDIGDPAEDVGRFLGFLWDWVAQQDYSESDGYKKIHDLQDVFIGSYIRKIIENNTIEEKNQKVFERIFKENLNFYKLRYYRAIFNVTKHKELQKDKEIKLKLLNSWIEENIEGSKQCTWGPGNDEDLISGYLPDRPAGFVESAPEGSNESYLTLLKEKLRQKGTATLSSNVTLAGMGGIGKTSLALEYAHLHKKAYDLIYWLPSETESSLLKGYKKLLQEIDVPIKGVDDDHIIELVNKHLPKKGRSLLIYDNAPHPTNFSALLKGKMPENADILITSRFSEGWGDQLLPLDVFRPEDSTEYFLNITKLEPTEENKNKAGNLAHALAHLPLALSHAASYIKLVGGDQVSGDTFEKYLEDFNKDSTFHFENHKSLHDIEMTYENLIARTLRLSRNYISELAGKLLEFCSYLDPDSIAEEIFLDLCESKKELEEAFNQLASLSLIKQQDESFFSIHRLVQLVMRNEQERGGLNKKSQNIIPEICIIFNNFFINNIYTNEQIDKLNIYLNHVLSLVQHSRNFMVFCQEMESLEWIGKILYYGQLVQEEETSMGSIKNKDKNKKLKKILEKVVDLFKNCLIYEDFPDWLRQIFEISHPMLQCMLGEMYKAGLFVNKDSKKAFSWCLLAANQGYARAQDQLGLMLSDGHEIVPNYAEALKWYCMAAEQWYARAQHNLALMYFNGYGVPQAFHVAFEWFVKAAEQGYENSQYKIGCMYCHGQGVDQSDAEAFKWCLRAAEKGQVEAQESIGAMYFKGQGVEQDFTKAFKWFLEAAEQGDLDCQNNIGSMYKNGQGVDQNFSEAYKWFTLAADEGNAIAQYNIGIMYANGEGVEQSDAEAFFWYLMAAELGNIEAQSRLGNMYYNGCGVDQNFSEAYKWFSLAAKQGDSTAQFNIGLMYDNGQEVNQSDIDAFKWYKTAARLGHVNAQHNLGVMYTHGQGVERNLTKAFKWYLMAAEQGHAGAQYNIGVMYANGLGVDQDNALAFTWYWKAAEQGDQGAIAVLEGIQNDL